MARASRLAILILMVWLSGRDRAAAQITGTLRGTVTDAQGAVLPGATITVTGAALRRSDVVEVTGPEGRYRIAGLSAGTYDLLVTLQGFTDRQLTGIRLGVNDDIVVDVTLAVAGLAETITVTTETPVVDVSQTGLVQAVTTETIENMPLNGRQFLDLLGLAPGTAPRPATSQQGSGVTVFGERSITNSFLVDGMENNDDFTRDFAEFYIQDVIQEFKIELGGFQAEFGRASGAVANVVTKSGTNQFLARAFLFGRDDALDSSNVEGQDPPKLRRTEVGGYLSGPIVSNKTWFFGALQYLKETRGTNFDLSRVPQVIRDNWFSPTVAEDFEIEPVVKTLTTFGKIDQRLGSKNQFFATTNINLGTRENFVPSPEAAFGSPPPGSIALPSTASDIETNSYSVTARNTTFVSNRSFFETSFRYLRNRAQENAEKTRGAEQLFPGTFNELNQVTFWLSNASSVGILDRKSQRYQLAEVLNLFRDFERGGRHDLKFGIDFNRVLLDRDFLAPQTMIVANTFYQNNYQNLDLSTAELQRTLTSTLGDKTLTTRSNNVLGLFGQDSWEIASGVTINAGLRYDYASLFSEDKDNLSPRVGVAWDPFKNAKTVVRSSYGLYYDQNILELATAVPELGGLQFTTWAQQIIPRGASTYDNPAIGAFGPLQGGGTRWLGNPKLFSYLLPAGAVRTSGNLSITGLGQPYIIYELLGIPVTDPRNPPVLTFDSIGQLTGGRHTPASALAVLNTFFPNASHDHFVWDDQPPEGSILTNRSLVYRFRTSGPGISRITTLQHPTQTPYTRSFNVGVQQALAHDLSVGVDFFVRQSRELLAGRVINLRPQPISASCLGNTVDGQPCNNQLQYLGFLDSNVLTLSVSKRLSNRYQFIANYTFTDAEDNFSTLRVPPKGGETSFLFSNQPDLDIGRSLNTPVHVFVTSGLVQAPWGIDIAGILKTSSGFPFNAAGGGLDSDGDEIFDNRLVGTEKGAFLSDHFFTIDLRLAKEFRFGGPRNLMLMFEVFNLTNRANPFRINTALGPTIGQTIEPLPGREIQLGFRIDF
jgi:outer membrane receptor protein involved in Fe transport